MRPKGHFHGLSATDTSNDHCPVENAFITASSSIPFSCMRTDYSVCMCHLDEGEHSLSDAMTPGSHICDCSSSATNVDIENVFLPPLSSSPPEIASSSPHSALSDEEGSVETFVSSSPFHIPSLSGRSPALMSDDFSRHAKLLEHTLSDNELCTTSRTPWLTRSSPISSALRTAPSSRVLTRSCSCPRICPHTRSPGELRPFHRDCYCVNNGQPGAENLGSAFEGKKILTRPSISRPEDDGQTLSPSNILGIAPITFSSNPENQKYIQKSPIYRLIKRPRSYNNLQLEEPLLKRIKINYGPISDHSRRLYASRTASLRRAESLKTTSDLDSPQSGDLNVDPPTPNLEVPPRRLRRWAMEKVIPYPVPIIAPSENHAVGLPVNAEILAIMRVRKFLERESDQRAVEGLSSELIYAGTSGMDLLIDVDPLGSHRTKKRFFWESALGIGRERRLKAINWLLSVKPVVSERPASVGSPCSVGTSPISPSSSSDSSVTVASPTEVLHDLLDQLETSYETRFHACWMFLRYFYLIMSPRTSRIQELVSSRSDTEHPSKLEREGLELVTSDISVACLSLSVKFHRDFLDPLLPVYAQEYLALSPHGMSYDDLETAHRDVLSTFKYRLGVSPQLLMDELWSALPSLRELLCFERGWSRAMEHAWIVLFRAVSEVDVQVFSISLLATVAVMDGIIQSLVYRNREELTTDSHSGMLGPIISSPSSHPVGSNPYCTGVSQEQARIEAEHVLCEIQSLVGVSNMHFRICRLWMEQFEEI